MQYGPLNQHDPQQPACPHCGCWHHVFDCLGVDVAKAEAAILSEGLPPTPAKYQRLFGWGYTRASRVLDVLRKRRVERLVRQAAGLE